MSTDAAPRSRPLIRRLWRQLLDEHAEPRRLGLGVGVGVLIGCSAFFGLQTLIALAAAWLLRLNKLAVLLGAQVSIPPLTAVIVFLGAQCGELLLHQRLLPLTLGEIRALPAAELLQTALVDLVVGGTVVGAVLGVVLGAATTRWVRKRRADEGPRLPYALLDALEDRAERLPRRWKSYAWWKVRLDPVYARIMASPPAGAAVLDLGAGMGLMSALAALKTAALDVRAVEWDGAKVTQGKALCDGLPVTFEAGDMFQASLGSPDAIFLLDVLHYSPAPAQRELLQRCAHALRPGGTVWVRDLGRSNTWAEQLERWAVRRGWNRGAGVEAWGAEQIATTLAQGGLQVTAEPSGRGLFRGNVLVIGRKASREA